jgi:hypothetical protein
MQNLDRRLEPGFKELWPWASDKIDRASKIIRFYRTRQKILNGEMLWNLSKDEIDSSKLLGPWQFNIFQSVLSALPVIVMTTIWGFLSPAVVGSKPMDPDFLSPAAWEFARKLCPAISSLVLPLSLAILSSTAAHGSLLPSDIASSSLRRTKYAYLYLDATLGFWSQTLIVTSAWCIATFSHVQGDFAGAISFASMIALAVAIPSQLCVTYYTVPANLFEINGYVSSARHSDKRGISRPPWGRYYLYVFHIGAFLILAVFLLAILLAVGGGVALAYIQQWVRIKGA